MSGAGEAYLGLRVRTGRALALAIGGDRAEPTAIARAEVELGDPKHPDSRQPFHLLLDTELGRGEARAERAANQARRAGGRALDAFVRDALGRRRLQAVAVVANSNTPPERIGNLHMRAHALEGWLFREICERLGDRVGIEPVTYLVGEIAALQGPALAEVLRRLGAGFGRPWNRDWKLAASAAWMQMRE